MAHKDYNGYPGDIKNIFDISERGKMIEKI